MVIVCERWAGDWYRLLYWPQVLPIIAALGWCCCWVTGDPKPSVCKLFSRRHLVSNWLEPPRAPGYISVSRPLASAVLLLIYTCACLDWQLGRGSIYNKIYYIYIYIYIHTRYIKKKDRKWSYIYPPKNEKIKNISKTYWQYIYCHLQPDCFVLSELFSVARYVGRLEQRSKPVQLYVSLSIRPLGQQATTLTKGIIR